MKKTLLVFCLALAGFVSKAQTIYVNYAASGANDGSSWANAYTDLQTAITNTSSGEIWVAQGSYFPGASGNNAATFTLKNNVALYGGFNGTETLLSQRNFVLNNTALNGDLDMSGTFTSNDAYHVVTTGNTNSTAILDGFTITGGNSTAGGLAAVGGGIYCDPTIGGAFNPIIRYCTISGNNCTGNGAGMHITCDQTGGNSTGPSIQMCRFNNNTSAGQGGAIYIIANGSLTFAIPTIENCAFSNNQATGGANQIFAQNTATGEVHVQITGSTFYGNYPGDEIYYLKNGINGTFEIDNSIFYNQELGTDDVITANYNCGPTAVLSGTGNFDADPLFINPGINDFKLSCLSPCLQAGNNSYTTLSEDLSGNQRIVGSTVDMGAYEMFYTVFTAQANASASVICNGQLTTLYGSGSAGLTYTWSHGLLDSVAYALSVSDTYTLTASDGGGCTSTSTISITVNPTPIVIANFSDPDYNVCIGDMVTLYATGDALSYLWDNGISDNVPFVANPATTFYTLVGTNSFGCTTTTGMSFGVEDPSTLTAGVDVNLCNVPGATVSLFATTSGFPINWTTLGAGTFDNTSISNPIYSLSPADLLSGTVNLPLELTMYACPNFLDTVVINIVVPPVVTAPADVTVCETDTVFLNGIISGGTGPFIANWTNPGAISNNLTGDYYFPFVSETIALNVYDVYGCGASDTFLIYVDASEIISGTAYLGAGVLTSGIVHLIKYYPQPQLFDTLTSTALDGLGNYAFPPVPHGNYIVSVEPDTILFPTALITYLGDQTRSELANILGHGCTAPVIASLNVQQLLGGTGTGKISGEIVEDLGFGLRYNGSHNHIMVPGGPLKGIDVKLGKNPGGGIQARTSSNDLGKYNFDNLPDGSYNIYVDIPGLPMDSFYVVNVISDSTTNLVYYADSNSVYPILPTAVGIKDYTTEQMGMGVHPNPANNYTIVLFETSSVNSSTQLKVYDVTGKMAMSLNLTNLPKGKHEYHLNFTNQQLQSGIYFIELTNESGKQTKKLIVE